MTRRQVWLASLAGAAAVLVIAITVWPSSGPASQPRTRIYRSTTACLLTGASGLADSQAAAVWAGLQDASARTHVQVTHLAVAGAATRANAMPYLNAQVQQKCAVIVAVGAPQTAAAQAGASAYPQTKFMVLGGTATARNLSVLAPGLSAAVRGEVAAAVEYVVGAGS